MLQKEQKKDVHLSAQGNQGEGVTERGKKKPKRDAVAVELAHENDAKSHDKREPLLPKKYKTHKLKTQKVICTISVSNRITLEIYPSWSNP